MGLGVGGVCQLTVDTKYRTDGRHGASLEAGTPVC